MNAWNGTVERLYCAYSDRPFETLRFLERPQAQWLSADQAKGLAEELAAHRSRTLVSKTDLELAPAPVRADL